MLEEHVKCLKNVPKAWNHWRNNNPQVFPDLVEAIFIEADLRGANLRDANLRDANLRDANLSKADLNRAILSEADLNGAILSEAKLSKAILVGADLSGADLSWADLSWADLSGGNLSKANLGGADLSRADLHGANLVGADLSGADLSGAILSEADLNGAEVRMTNFAALDLNTAKGLGSLVHTGPCSVGIDTFFLSLGKLPEIFLRGCGVPDVFIDYASSLTAKPFDFYSVFISYSSKDEAFAKRLYADLQANGIRCWFAPADLKIGDKFRVRIDESIRAHDKLLLILSVSSVESDWVEKEVETALERERKEKRPVLFPISVDDAVMNVKNGWPADIRRSRHIGDFRQWTDYEAYSRAFQRLLRDLKTTSKT